MTVAMLKRSQLPRSEWPEKRALAGELRAMSDRELLALILGSGVRDANVKQVAATLLRKFGEDLLTADAAALRQVKGVGEVKAARLAAAFELYRKLANGSALRPVKTPQDAYWVCQDLSSEKQEVLGYLALDVRNRLLERVDLYKGNETLAVADPKHIFRTALGKGAQALVIYHNHPSGSLDPSTHDRDLARRLVEAGKLLNLPLLDFIIVARQGYYSLREQHIQGEGLSWAAEPGVQLTLADALLPAAAGALAQKGVLEVVAASESSMPRRQRNIGFDGRMFLDEAEWVTYCKRKPVRYIRTCKTGDCQVCGNPESPDNPLQSAHIIGFDVGVVDLGLTPDFLDSRDNIITAHRRECNKRSELDLERSMGRLRELGVENLPEYLPSTIRQLWHGSTVQRGAGDE